MIKNRLIGLIIAVSVLVFSPLCIFGYLALYAIREVVKWVCVFFLALYLIWSGEKLSKQQAKELLEIIND